MKKSISDLTAESAFSHTTTFSMLGDSIMGGSNPLGSSYGNITSGSSHLTQDNHRRAWDWRKGWRRDTKPGKLIRKLRMALAEEVAGAWIGDTD